MPEGLSFRRGTRPSPRGAGALLAVLLVALALAAVVRPLARPTLPPQARLVEVRGEVPSPGTYLIDRGRLHAALAAAGAPPIGSDREVPEGHVVQVGDGGVEVLPPPQPLLVGLPLDVNVASVDQLMAVPGIGATMAGAIVSERRTGGPYRNLDELQRADGIGPTTLERLAPFLVVSDPRPTPEPGPIDLNAASAATLEGLPGIGPVTAARIVVHRAEHGPFADVDALQAVEGIGPATIEALRHRAVAE